MADNALSPYWQALMANAQSRVPTSSMPTMDMFGNRNNTISMSNPEMQDVRNQFSQWGLSREDANTTRQRALEDRTFAESQRQFNARNDLLKQLLGSAPQFGQMGMAGGGGQNPFTPRVMGSLYSPYSTPGASAQAGGQGDMTNYLRRLLSQDHAVSY